MHKWIDTHKHTIHTYIAIYTYYIYITAYTCIHLYMYIMHMCI